MANKCPQCGYEAEDQDELKEHMKIHKGSQERDTDPENM